MSATLDWSKLAAGIDHNMMTQPAGWDTMPQEKRAETEYGSLISAVVTGYKKAKAQEIIDVMLLDPQPFVVSSEADILNRPSPKWLVQDLIQEDTIALLAGPGGLGKSFMALSIARALATNAPFFGKKTQRGKTLYVAAEGVSAFGDRVRAWNYAHNSLTVPDDAISYVEQGVNLKDPSSVETLARMVAEGDYSLVILDTLSQLGHVENENAAGEVSAVFRAIKSIRDGRVGTSVLVLDHTPMAGGKPRGSTAKRDNSDTVIMAIPAGDSFTLSTRNDDGGKQKDGVELEWHGFGLTSVLNSAVVTNNGGKRDLSPFWALCLEVLKDGKAHSSTELKEACGIEGDMRSAEGKKLGRELEHWTRDELVVRSGSKTRPTYTLTQKVEAVL